MEFVSKERIKIGRELSELDTFALDFIRVLGKHTSYAVVSGYVAILLGRARASEDIDIIIPRMSLPDFSSLYNDLASNGFECINTEGAGKTHEHLMDGLAARFARKGNVIPNIELKFAKTRIDNLALKNRLTVTLDEGDIIVSSLEMQIAFKENVLKSPKDIEDARHIRNVAEGHLDNGMIKEYKRMIHELSG